MRGWKTVKGVPIVECCDVPVPHEGLEGDHLKPKSQQGGEFPFPMRGWKNVDGASSGQLLVSSRSP